MPPYTDLHCHILPDVDDGPSTLADSLALARSLVDFGITHAVATPHYIDDYSKNFRLHVQEKYIRLVDAVHKEEIPLTLHLGGELLLTPTLVGQAAEGTLPSLERTSYVLVELPLHQPLPLYTPDVIFGLQAHGYRPVLAHPERVAALKKDITWIYNLIRKGVLIQGNLGSLAGLYGSTARNLMKKMFTYDLVHFVGSDSHDASLFPFMAKAHDKITPPLDTFMGTNPTRALRNEVVPSFPRKPGFRFKDKLVKFLK